MLRPMEVEADRTEAGSTDADSYGALGYLRLIYMDKWAGIISHNGPTAMKEFGSVKHD